MYSIFYYAQVVILLAMVCTLFLFKRNNSILYKINSACLTVCSSMFFLLEYIVRNVVDGYSTDELVQLFYFLEKPKYSFTFVFWILTILCFVYIIFYKKKGAVKKCKFSASVG